jgi:hypothetical protein
MKNCPFCNCEISADHISDIHPITCYFVARQVLDDPKDIDRLNAAWDERPGEDALNARIAELEKDSVNDQRIIAVQNEDLRKCMERIAELEKLLVVIATYGIRNLTLKDREEVNDIVDRLAGGK